MSDPPLSNTLPASVPDAVGWTRADLMTLTKARLSTLVVATTAAGYVLSPTGDFASWGLVHTLFGTTLTAFGAAVFNQVMEVEPDAKMHRTADRPLPGKRVPPAAAFMLGWLLAAVGMIHLGVKVNTESAALAALTLVTYLFIYTPMKQRSTMNTLVGAVSGAIPPVIGWVAASGPHNVRPGILMWELFVQPQALFLFTLLFLWQLPHFLSINWMYRAEYIRGGFVMWSNDDVSGRKTARLAIQWSLPLLALCFWPGLAGFASHWFIVPSLIATGLLLKLCFAFYRSGARPDARKLFFATLIYLPVMLIALLIAAR